MIDTRTYHHGDLRRALLIESERILEREGIQALTLRAAARAVGVSHTAPQNHFGDLSGLLSDLAALGFRRFGIALEAAVEAAGDDPAARTRALGRAYVGFAADHPGLFTLMFRHEKLDPQHQGLRDAIAEARQLLKDAAARQSATTVPGSPRDIAATAVALWSLVHGYAVLMLEGRLEGTLSALPQTESAQSFLDAVLDALKPQGH